MRANMRATASPIPVPVMCSLDVPDCANTVKYLRVILGVDTDTGILNVDGDKLVAGNRDGHAALSRELKRVPQDV